MNEYTTNAGPITTREELIYALSRAAEVEHGLTCIYLFAAYSMKRFTHEDIDEVQQDEIRNWEGVVLAVAKQEMEHLGIVCNLLNAIGAPQHFDRPNLPQSPSYYATEDAFSLQPFSVATIRAFMDFEIPATTDFKHGSVEGDGFVPDNIRTTDFHTVQELYATILKGFEHLDAQGNLFIGPSKAQVNDTDIIVGFDNREYGIEMVEVTDLKTAKQAIDIIIEQGEGIPLEQPFGSQNAKRLQMEYAAIADAVQKMGELDFSDDWRAKAEYLKRLIEGLFPGLEHTREILADEIPYLVTQYTDPAWPESLPERMTIAISKLEEQKYLIESLLEGDDPPCPADAMLEIRCQTVLITKYDVEGIVLSGFTNPDSHYVRFWQIYEQLKIITYEPARNVAQNPALRIHPDNEIHQDKVTIAKYSYTRDVMELSNASYETMVQMLILTFSYNGISKSKRRLLFHTAFFPFMSMVIRPVSELLTLLPIHNPEKDHEWKSDLCAGSSFEYYMDVALLPNRKAGWIYLQERLDEIAAFSDRVTNPPDELVNFMGTESFEYLGKQMVFLNQNLNRIRKNFAAGPQPVP